jgi:hypothetical protein
VLQGRRRHRSSGSSAASTRTPLRELRAGNAAGEKLDLRLLGFVRRSLEGVDLRPERHRTGSTAPRQLPAGEAAESLELSGQEPRPDLHLLCGRPADPLAEVLEQEGGAVHQRNWRLHGELGGEGWEVHGHPAV